MSATVVAAMSGVPVNMQTAATTGNGTVIAPPFPFRNHNIMITGITGTTAGAISIETSNDPNDAGTWALATTAVTVIQTTDLLTQLTGIFMFLRARVSTTISGGSTPGVNVVYVGSRP